MEAAWDPLLIRIFEWGVERIAEFGFGFGYSQKKVGMGGIFETYFRS
jgi:hypothetical protein